MILDQVVLGKWVAGHPCVRGLGPTALLVESGNKGPHPSASMVGRRHRYFLGHGRYEYNLPPSGPWRPFHYGPSHRLVVLGHISFLESALTAIQSPNGLPARRVPFSDDKTSRLYSCLTRRIPGPLVVNVNSHVWRRSLLIALTG